MHTHAHTGCFWFSVFLWQLLPVLVCCQFQIKLAFASWDLVQTAGGWIAGRRQRSYAAASSVAFLPGVASLLAVSWCRHQRPAERRHRTSGSWSSRRHSISACKLRHVRRHSRRETQSCASHHPRFSASWLSTGCRRNDPCTATLMYFVSFACSWVKWLKLVDWRFYDINVHLIWLCRYLYRIFAVILWVLLSENQCKWCSVLFVRSRWIKSGCRVCQCYEFPLLLWPSFLGEKMASSPQMSLLHLQQCTYIACRCWWWRTRDTGQQNCVRYPDTFR